MIKNKVTVIGFDGLSPYSFSGKFELFNKFFASASYGKLTSTILPKTIPAWASMFTGMNPDSLGFRDTFKPGGGLATMLDVKHPFLWDYLDTKALSYGLYSIPMIYALSGKRYNGFVVPGFLAAKNNFYPPELQFKSKYSCFNFPTPNFPKTDWNDNRTDSMRTSYLSDLKDYATRKFSLVKDYFTQIESDVAVIIFSFTDWGSHFLWDSEKHRDMLYTFASEVLRDIFFTFESDSYFMVSDHGFGLEGEEDTKIYFDDVYRKRKARNITDPYKGNTVFREPGGHSIYGTFATWGNGIAKNNLISGARIIDVTPTILNRLNIETDKQFDGEPLLGIYETNVPTETERDKIIENMKGLGYM